MPMHRTILCFVTALVLFSHSMAGEYVYGPRDIHSVALSANSSDPTKLDLAVYLPTWNGTYYKYDGGSNDLAKSMQAQILSAISAGLRFVLVTENDIVGVRKLKSVVVLVGNGAPYFSE